MRAASFLAWLELGPWVVLMKSRMPRPAKTSRPASAHTKPGETYDVGLLFLVWNEDRHVAIEPHSDQRSSREACLLAAGKNQCRN